MSFRKQMFVVFVVCVTMVLLDLKQVQAQYYGQGYQPATNSLWYSFGVDPYQRGNQRSRYPSNLCANPRSACSGTCYGNPIGSAHTAAQPFVDLRFTAPSASTMVAPSEIDSARLETGSSNMSGVAPPTGHDQAATNAIAPVAVDENVTNSSPSDIRIESSDRVHPTPATDTEVDLISKQDLAEMKQQLEAAINRARAAEEKAYASEKSARAAKAAAQEKEAQIRKNFQRKIKELEDKRNPKN